MALFKIHKGNEINLPSKATEGFAYFTEDKGHFFVDVASSDGVMFPEMNGDANACTHSLLLKHGYRVQLNAKEADFAYEAEWAENADLAERVRGIYFGQTEYTDVPGRWNTTIPDMTQLLDGDIIILKLNTNGNLFYDTLKIHGKMLAGGVQASMPNKMVYSSFNEELTTNISAGNTIMLIYRDYAHDGTYFMPEPAIPTFGTDNSGFILVRTTDYNYFDRQVETNNVRYVAEDLPRYSLVVADQWGRLHPLIQKENNENIPSDVWFRPEHLWYLNYGETIRAGDVVPDNVLYNTSLVSYVENFRTPQQTDAMWDGDEYSEIYLKGTLDKATGLFKLDTEHGMPVILVPTIPPADGGPLTPNETYFFKDNYYIYLGTVGETAARQFHLAPAHPVYFSNGSSTAQVVARSEKTHIIEGQNRTGTAPLDITMTSRYLLERLHDSETICYQVILQADSWKQVKLKKTINGKEREVKTWVSIWREGKLSCGHPNRYDEDLEPWNGDFYSNDPGLSEYLRDYHYVPPIISCLENDDEFTYIENADALPHWGIQFEASAKPKYGIVVYVVDQK